VVTGKSSLVDDPLFERVLLGRSELFAVGCAEGQAHCMTAQWMLVTRNHVVCTAEWWIKFIRFINAKNNIQISAT
jgi:hypothetical protein